MLKRDKHIQLVDVRGKEEYEKRHLPHAINISFDVLEQKANQLLDKRYPIFLYSAMGNRSKLCALILKDMGYQKVYDIGGIMTWPFDTITPWK